MPGRTPLPAPRAGVGFIDNDKFGTGPQKLVAAAVGLDEVKGDDDKGVVLEQGLSQRQSTLKPCSGARKNQCRVNVEFVADDSQYSIELTALIQRFEPDHVFADCLCARLEDGVNPFRIGDRRRA